MKVFLATLSCFLTLSVWSQTQQAEIAGTLELIGITKKLSEVKEVNFMDELFMKKKHEDEGRELSHQSLENSIENQFEDPALQKTDEVDVTGITVLSNWEGNKSKYLRSDNNIAVGPNHVVQMINSNSISSYIRVWNKTGDILINKATMYSLIGQPDYGDCNVIYDEKADRWVMSFLYSGANQKLIVICSVTADPTGAWYYYTFNTAGGYPDYPKLSVWRESYIITTAQSHPGVYVLNRNRILNGISASPVIKFSVDPFETIGWQGLSPIQETGSLSIPAGEPAIVWRVFDNWWDPSYSAVDKLELFELDINWDAPPTSTITGPISLPIANYNSDLCGVNSNECLEQPGTDVLLWPLSDYITDKSKYMNFGDHQSIVGVHVCRANAEGTAGQRWYELRKYPGGEWYIYQQGTYAPTDDHRFIGSISINEDGTIALGYNITSSTIYPGMRMTGRAACDPLNFMTAAETISKNGTASNFSLDYGDYNSLVTDPVDGSFWFSGQYNATSKWSSNVVHFTINGCPEGKQESNIEPSIYDLHLSPVPANDQLTISFQSNDQSSGVIQIFDAIGKVVKEVNYTCGIGLNAVTVITANLPSGFYLLQLGDGSTVMTRRFVIER